MLNRRFLRTLRLLSCGLALCCVAKASFAQDDAPLIFNLAAEPKTIGDIKPVFIVYKDKPLPDVSVEYVMKRYIKLFEETASPDVRIDALNRINNLSALYGISGKKLSIDKVKQSQAVLDSYDSIVDSGVFYERMDELLYQTAKASEFTGNSEESIKRLKLLVGLYPNSPLVDESVFRIGEAFFNLGRFADAEAQYKKLLAFSEGDEFHQRTRFKLGWSVFRQDRFKEAVDHAFQVLAQYPSLKNATSVAVVEESNQDLVSDTLRLLAIMFSKQQSSESLELAQQAQKEKGYAYLLHDALMRFYLKQDRFQEAALVASAYASNYQDRFEAHRMALHAIKAYETGGFDIQAWAAKEDMVAHFGVDSYFWSSRSPIEQSTLKPQLDVYLQELAHLYYTKMQKADKEPAEQLKFATRAADYYQALTRLYPERGEANGEFIFLAAEAMREVGKFNAAGSLYERAAYVETEHANSERAAYLAIQVFDLKLSKAGTLAPEELDNKYRNILRFAERFADSKETPILLSYLASKRYEQGKYQETADLSARVLAHPKLSDQERFDALWVRAPSLYELQQYQLAENAYRQLLKQKRTQTRVTAVKEGLAASIYQQARNTEDLLASAQAYLRVADEVADASIVPQALHDAAAQFLSAAAWSQAIASLKHLQLSFPDHSLAQGIDQKLLYAYVENKDWVEAADKLFELVALEDDPNKKAQMHYQAAGYYASAGLENEANAHYESFLKRYPEAFDRNVQTYARVISYHDTYKTRQAQSWKDAYVRYERKNARLRSKESADLAAGFVMEKALASAEHFESLRLSVPLKASLKQKKAALDESIKLYESLADYKLKAWQAAATYSIAGLYLKLAEDLMASERPKGLSALELEQYDILLEEQAYPFEEKALELYALNTERAAEGQFDVWVRSSFDKLAALNPANYQRQLKVADYAAETF